MSTLRADLFAQKRRRALRRVLKVTTSALGAALVALLGWWLVEKSFRLGAIEVPKEQYVFGHVGSSFATSLARLSYDLPFTFRETIQTPGVCIVYMDENSARKLGQHPRQWSRALHTKLLRRLTRDGARLVFFDVVFSDEQPDVDGEFAGAIRENGHVFLGGALEISTSVSGEGRTSDERALAPARNLRAAAAGWGLIAFRPVDADYGVRRIFTGMDTVPTATWRAAIALGAQLEDTPESRAEARWLNYYGPTRSLLSVPYHRALDGGDLPAGFFKDQIVFVGGRPTLAELTLQKDEFRSPYCLFGDEFSDGVGLHLTMLQNLVRGDFLRRLSPRAELSLAVAVGLLLGGLLPVFRPHVATALALLGIAALVSYALWSVQEKHVWFAWCIPAFVQAPVALLGAIGTRYFTEERRRAALRDAFGHYLSPQMADRIADAEFDLAPGGEMVEAALLITDLEGFTPLAEELHDPELVLRILTEYFTRTTTHLLDCDGTIINFVGDSVFAVWGAPLPDADGARKAALAAWRLHETSRIEVGGHILRTRVGVHIGSVLAGNVGSERRFDYAVIGDAVNFASRLEGLNKHLGTSVLISDALFQKMGVVLASRCVGEFRVVGKKESHVVHELLGPAEFFGRPEWPAIFARGLEAFHRGDFDTAGQLMRETIAARGGTDGPSAFYLREIAALSGKPLSPGWSGVVEITSK